MANSWCIKAIIELNLTLTWIKKTNAKKKIAFKIKCKFILYVYSVKSLRIAYIDTDVSGKGSYHLL